MYEITKIFDTWAKIFTENEKYLTELDSVAGDADLGIVMHDGFVSTAEFVKQSSIDDVGMLFYQAGKHFNNVASSSMGTLLSSGLMVVGKNLKGKKTIEDGDFHTIVSGIAQGVMNIGKAKEGEKTFLDGIMPAERALANCDDVAQGLKAAVKASQEGVEKAKGLVAKHGRIAFRGQDSVGITDPGSVVASLIVQGLDLVVNKD